MLKRNRHMVDKSDNVIAVFNGIEKDEPGTPLTTLKKQIKLSKL